MKTLPTTQNCLPVSTNPNPPTPISTGYPAGWFPNTSPYAVLDGDVLNSLLQDIRALLVAGGQDENTGDILPAIQQLIADVTGGTEYLPLTGGTLTGAVAITGAGLSVGEGISAGGTISAAGGTFSGNVSISSSDTLTIGSTVIGTNSFNLVAGTEGYQYLPGGLIMQWGQHASSYEGSGALVTFPIAFPNACFNVQATNTLLASNNHVNASEYSTSGFRLSNSAGTVGASDVAAWFAIGN